MQPGHRRCLVLRGPWPTMRARAERLVAQLPPDAVLWPGDDVRRALGQGRAAVVLSLHAEHGGLDADALGAAAGLVVGDGALIVAVPDTPPAHARLAVPPFGVDDVGHRFWRRVQQRLPPDDGDDAPLPPPRFVPQGTAEQAAVVDALVTRVARGARVPRIAPVAPERATRTALLAGRGRGKSSALGLFARVLGATGQRVVVTAPHDDAVAEVRRFAADAVRFVAAPALLGGEADDADVILVDEAAQFPVPWLRAVHARFARTPFVFATTTHGYEGTGRGFVLRFLEALPDVAVLRLHDPIRWAKDDPLEALLDDALLLSAPLSSLPPPPTPTTTTTTTTTASSTPSTHATGWPAPVRLDRDALADDERLLASLFGLLVHAHYRTTPEDLHRLLDAPNLAVHAVVDDGVVVGASLVAREGGLPAALCAALARGRERVRGHALADTLVTHAARPDAGTLRLLRSVRIATHPDARRRHLGRDLVEHVHATHPDVELFGTVFGATAALVRFRQAQGYVVVRVGVGRGARSGEPAVVMVRPSSSSPAAAALVHDLRAELARDLSLQLLLLDADGALPLDPDLRAALGDGLPAPIPLDDAGVAARVRRYLGGPQPAEAAAAALHAFVVGEGDAGLAALAPRERALVRGRLVEHRAWDAVARAAGYPSTAQAMRALRPAIRHLWNASGGDGDDDDAKDDGDDDDRGARDTGVTKSWRGR